ncbi:MAG: SAF domain-containing protein, partial [Planctomycetia bacterium]
MTAPRSERRPTVRAQRPKATTVFAAAFLAGAAAAVGLNRTLDVHLAQRRPRVESEPIFVALRSLPQGAPLTVWDVALRDWPKAMLPAAAMRPRDSFEGMVLKHPLREGQPILSVQLAMASAPGESQVAEAAVVPAPAPPD